MTISFARKTKYKIQNPKLVIIHRPADKHALRAVTERRFARRPSTYYPKEWNHAWRPGDRNGRVDPRNFRPASDQSSTTRS
jgi:hypothetical protein